MNGDAITDCPGCCKPLADHADACTVSIFDIERAYRSGHWFSAATKRFFRSRMPQYGYAGSGGIFFVSSEQFVTYEPSYRADPRAYTVRRLRGVSDIVTIGEVQAYANRRAATAEAKALADGGGNRTGNLANSRGIE